MSIILFPFKILAIPAKMILGLVGVFIAALVYAIAVRQGLCWVAWNAPANISLFWLNVGTFAAFVLTFVAAGSKK